MIGFSLYEYVINTCKIGWKTGTLNFLIHSKKGKNPSIIVYRFKDHESRGSINDDNLIRNCIFYYIFDKTSI